MKILNQHANNKKNGSFSLVQQASYEILLTVSPQKFYSLFAPWVLWLSYCALGTLAIGSVWALAFAPPDYLQGNSYRIMYVHVPMSSLAMSLFLVIAILSGIFLVWKIKIAKFLIQALAAIGFWCCLLSMLTGSIWAKPTWGTHWVWDGRLTSVFILAMLYAGVMALFSINKNTQSHGKVAAVFAIIGAVILPIIKYSVHWWNTLHQGATFTLTEAPKMPASMWLPLLVMIIGFYMGAAALAIYKTNTIILQQEQAKNWVKQLIRGNTTKY